MRISLRTLSALALSARGGGSTGRVLQEGDTGIILLGGNGLQQVWFEIGETDSYGMEVEGEDLATLAMLVLVLVLAMAALAPRLLRSARDGMLRAMKHPSRGANQHECRRRRCRRSTRPTGRWYGATAVAARAGLGRFLLPLHPAQHIGQAPNEAARSASRCAPSRMHAQTGASSIYAMDAHARDT